jgi:HlyD family secretion protein
VGWLDLDVDGGRREQRKTMAKRKSRKLRNIIVGLFLVAVVGASVAAALLRNREVMITVQTETVVRRDMTETVVATGRIQPITKVTINPEVSGEIVDLPVKDGQAVKRGDLLLRIKPDNYIASLNSAKASYLSAQASQNTARANLEKAELEFARARQLYEDRLVSDSQLLDAQTSFNVAQAQFEASIQQVAQARATVDRAEDDLAKTTILAPMDGTVTQLRSERGERVVGTGMMAGTEIMTIANLEEMEARVDIGEIDVVLVSLGQKARLEVDAFRDRHLNGVVSEIAYAATTTGAGTQAEATRFQVKIRIEEKEPFRPGMSVTADIETRYRTNVIAVPIQSVTTRLPRAAKPSGADEEEGGGGSGGVSRLARPDEVVFLVEDGKAVMRKVERGISDDTHTEILSGVEEGAEVVSGGYRAISRDLEDGQAVRVGPAPTVGLTEGSTP